MSAIYTYRSTGYETRHPEMYNDPMPLNQSNRKSIPENILFDYEEDNVLPIFARRSNGQPYSGEAEGSVSSADWYGNYLKGLPHGSFIILWGGIRSSEVQFDQGVIVKDS